MDRSCTSDGLADVLAKVPAKVPAKLLVYESRLHQTHDATIAALKARLSRIVPTGVAPDLAGSAGVEAAINQHRAWSLGAPEIDARLGPAGLELGGVHEIALGSVVKLGVSGPSMASVAASARLFALFLLRRRLGALRRAPSPGLLPAYSPQSYSKARVLWCATPTDLRDGGQLYGPALVRMGFDPAQVIFVTPGRAADVLWAMEEGLRSNTLAAVVGQIDNVGLTPARRLALAAAAAHTPCLLVANERAGPVAAVATRWRVGPLRSGPTGLADPLQSGWRMSIGLERCRARPVGSESVMFAGEWSEDAHCFRVVAGPADRAVASGIEAECEARAGAESGTRTGAKRRYWAEARVG